MFNTQVLSPSAESNEGIVVLAYREQLDTDETNVSLWGYCLRIENNSSQKIRLLRKNLSITDSTGKSIYDTSYGFHGELPDLEPGECFEFDDTTTISADEAVLYGTCTACTEDGHEFEIKLPLISLLSDVKNTLGPAFIN